MTRMAIAFVLALFLAPEVSNAETQADPETSRIDVTVAPVRVKDGGSLLLALYADEDSWLDLEKALARRIVPAKSDTIEVTFEDVPLGRYALVVIHDKNENGKLDMRKFPYPKPKEGTGVSNNNRRWGKPDYSKALFSVEDEPAALIVELNY